MQAGKIGGSELIHMLKPMPSASGNQSDLIFAPDT